jgi:peptide/nickel transport system ATP-binding protein
LRSIPSIMATPRTKLATISGSIPHAFARPRGCAFHPRCVDIIPRVCESADPSLFLIEDGCEVSCFHYGPRP